MCYINELALSCPKLTKKSLVSFANTKFNQDNTTILQLYSLINLSKPFELFDELAKETKINKQENSDYCILFNLGVGKILKFLKIPYFHQGRIYQKYNKN